MNSSRKLSQNVTRLLQVINRDERWLIVINADPDAMAIQAGAEGIGFAIPINKARRVVAQLVGSGRVTPAWLGLWGQDVDPRTARYFGLARPKGLLVTAVLSAGPAAKAGLKPGDLLVAMT